MTRTVVPGTRTTRLLTGSWLVNTVGSGMYFPTSALYFTRVAGFGAATVGVTLTVAGLVALATAVPIGWASDRFGARPTYLALLAVQAVAMATFAVIDSYLPFLLTATVFMIGDQGASGVRGALVATYADGADRVRLRSFLRVVTNVGMGVGALVATVAIAVDAPGAYRALLLLNAATFLLAVVPIVRLGAPAGPADRSAATAGHAPVSRWAVLTDARYVGVTLITGALMTQLHVLSFALPLWIAGHTTAPPALASIAVVVNTVLIVALQVAMSRGTDHVPYAARCTAFAGLALLAGCAALAVSGSVGTAWAVVVVLLAAVLLTLGEIWTSAGGYGLSFALAPESAHGQYQGFFSMGRGVAAALAPALLGVLVLGDLGAVGWLVLGAGFAVIGALAPFVVRTGGR